MSSHSRLVKAFGRSRLGAFLCAAAVFSQAAFPVLHEWHEANAEAAYHQGESASAGPAVKADSETSRNHHHHDAETCRTCLNFYKGRHAAPLHAVAAPATSRAVAVVSVAEHFVAGLYPSSGSPRSPPLA